MTVCIHLVLPVSRHDSKQYSQEHDTIAVFRQELQIGSGQSLPFTYVERSRRLSESDAVFFLAVVNTPRRSLYPHMGNRPDILGERLLEGWQERIRENVRRNISRDICVLTNSLSGKIAEKKSVTSVHI